MKKLAVALAAVASVAALAVGGVAASGDGGTLYASGFGCAVFDGNGNLFVTNNSEEWVYASKAVLRCSGYGAPAASLTLLTGFGCNTLHGFTYDTADKIGRAGNSQLTCTKSLAAASSAAQAGAAGVG